MADVQRRELYCESLDEVAAEARRLLESGYEPAGKWNLAQACGHCSTWMKYPIDGFPKFNFFVAGVFWMMKQTFGKRTFKKCWRQNRCQRATQRLKKRFPHRILNRMPKRSMNCVKRSSGLKLMMVHGMLHLCLAK